MRGLCGSLFLAFLLVVLPAVLPAEEGPAPPKIVFGSSEDYPPFSWESVEDKPTGFLRDIIQAMAKAEGFQAEIQVGDWNRTRQRLRTGEIDAIDGMYYTIGRDREFDFSEPHSIVTHSIFVWKEDKSIRSLRDLRGRSVLAMRGDIMHEFILNEKIGVNLILTRTQREAIELLSYHRAQAALVARLPALYYIQELGIDNVKEIGKPLEPMDFCFAVREGNREILERLNRGLAAVKTSGEYERIRKRWFEPLEMRREIEVRKLLPYLLLALLLIALFSGALWLWNWALQQQVRLQTETLRITNERLQKMDKVKTEIVNTVAHEVRAPLGVMQGYLDFLRDASLGDLSPRQQEIAGKIQATIDRLNRMVGDFLDLSRVREGRLELQPSNVDVGSLAGELASFFHDQFRMKEIRFETQLYPPAICLEADRDRIEQCLINLISNAIKYTPLGGQLSLIARDLGDSVQFEVHDTGAGIPRHRWQQVFEKFETTSAEAARGYGLGLAITKALIELHQGKIWVESREGKGSTFYFMLPKFYEP